MTDPLDVYGYGSDPTNAELRTIRPNLFAKVDPNDPDVTPPSSIVDDWRTATGG